MDRTQPSLSPCPCPEANIISLSSAVEDDVDIPFLLYRISVHHSVHGVGGSKTMPFLLLAHS